jgi:glucose-1-phosphate thymidylyltransferase
MKGVILAGGLGTRLHPLTRVTNKHLLPIYDRPMIYYPIQQLVHAGVEDILLVTGGESAGDFLRLLGNGSRFGLRHLNYTYQEGEGGIAEALGLARHFADDQPVAVMLGDNVFEDPIAPAIAAYESVGSGAMILLKEVDDPQRFGVARLDGDRIVEILEKPHDPPSRLAVTGCYIYDPWVYEIIDGLSPSKRGELEITDVNNRYLARGELRYQVLDGWWTDAGTIPSLFRATSLVARSGANPVLRQEFPGGSVPPGS